MTTPHNLTLITMAKPVNKIDEQVALSMIVDGKSLREIAAAMGVSAYKVYTDLTATPELEKQYARAKELQAEMMADDIVQISDDGRNDTYTTDEGVQITNHDVIARSRLRVDARKWVAAKLLPKKYGDRVQVDNTHSFEQESTDDLLARATKLAERFKDSPKSGLLPRDKQGDE